MNREPHKLGDDYFIALYEFVHKHNPDRYAFRRFENIEGKYLFGTLTSEGFKPDGTEDSG